MRMSSFIFCQNIFCISLQSFKQLWHLEENCKLRCKKGAKKKPMQFLKKKVSRSNATKETNLATLIPQRGDIFAAAFKPLSLYFISLPSETDEEKRRPNSFSLLIQECPNGFCQKSQTKLLSFQSAATKLIKYL